MRKSQYFILCIIGLLFTNSGIAQQSIIFEKLENYRPIKGQGILADSVTGVIKVGLLQIDNASKLNQKGIFIIGSTNTQFNWLRLYTFSKDLKFEDMENLAYTNTGAQLEHSTDILTTKHYTTKEKATVERIYSTFLPTNNIKTKTILRPYIYGAVQNTEVYDDGVYEYIPKDDQTLLSFYDKSPSSLAGSSFEHFIDNNSNTITSIYGKDLGEKYSKQKHLLFVTFDRNKNMLDSFSINLPFPRNIEARILLHSKTNSNKVIGKVYIFSRMTILFGKKYNDPDENNYEIVACDTLGKLMFYKSFKVGDPKKSLFSPYYATFDGDKIWMMGKYRNENNYGIIVKTFNKEGIETSKELTKDTIFAKQVIEGNLKERTTAAFDYVGLTFSVIQNFTGMGNTTLANGDFLIWGKTSWKINDPSFKPKPGETMSFPPQVDQYHDFVCFHFTSTNELIKIYSSKLNNTLEMGSVSLLSSDDKLVFAMADPNKEISPLETQLFTIKSISTGKEWTYPSKIIYSPKFIILSPTTKTITGTNDNNMLLFTPNNFYVNLNNKHTVYYYGYNFDVKETQKQMLLMIKELKY